MTDPKTAADLEAEAVVAHQEKEQAAYDAKPCCGRCGHHPGDALHVCGKIDTSPEPTMRGASEAGQAHNLDREGSTLSPATIMAQGGVLTVQEYEAAMEVEGLPPPNKQDLVAKVNEWMPDATPNDKVAEAKRLMGRWMLMDIAYKGGLRIGRDLRQRTEHGIGWPMWEGLKELTPRERTYVLGKVCEHIGLGTWPPKSGKRPDA